MNVNLDRRVTIQQKTAAKSGQGAAAVTWSALATVWAEVRDDLPSRSENVSSGLETNRNQVRVRIRYRAGVDTSMRIVDDRGRTLQIIGGPAEMGRREFMEIYCEQVTP